MFESLSRIENPFLRSLTAASTALSVVIIASSLALGVTKAKDESPYKIALYTSLVGAGCGALFGLVYPVQENQLQTAQTLRHTPLPQSTESNTWRDWRNFVVVRKVKESEEITSFYLEPEDKGDLPNFQPGQFLTIKLDIPGQAKPVIRTYSLSDYPEPLTYYRLSIKREPVPPGLDVMPGLASNFMHDQIQEGSVIPAKPPSGKFVLDIYKSLPAVLISNGVGITPMIAMAKAATRLNPDRPIWFMHGARDGRFHAFRDEVIALAQSSVREASSTEGLAAPKFNVMVHYAYSRPREEDAGHYNSTGYVDIDLIRSLVTQEAEYFLCGSPSFMASMREGLKNAGVPDSHVFFEMFTKASKATTTERPLAETSGGEVERAEIVFAQSSKTVTWQVDASSLLDFAEANDLNPPYSCRQGICGTCECKILEGEVEYQTTPTATIAAGSVLICISKPKTAKVVLEL